MLQLDAGVEAALLAIWLSVALGTLLGASQRLAPVATDPIRTFALVAAALVVGMSLLPHALTSLGGLGLLAAAAGFAAIPALDRVLTLVFRSAGRRATKLELSYAGLLLHRAGDGVAMSVEGHGRDVLVALGAHEIPIVALVVLIYAREGLYKALVRAAWLGAASTLGLFLVKGLPALGWHGWHGWIDAVSAGILLHIVAHELMAERLQGAGERALDVLGAALAWLLVWLPAAEPEGAAAIELGLLERALNVAFPLLAGLALTAVGLSLFEDRSPHQALSGPRAFRRAAAGDARPDTFALSVALLGWPLALARSAGALALGAIAAAAARRARPLEPAETPAVAMTRPLRWRSLLEAFDRLSRATLAPVGLGLLAASYVEAFMPAIPSLEARAIAPSLLSVAAIAVPARICAPAATPIAAALLTKGLHPALALAGLWLGAASNASLVPEARAALGSAGCRRLLLITSLGSVALAALAAALLGGLQPLGGRGGPDWLRWPSLVCLALSMAYQVWRVGVRNWLGTSLGATARHGLKAESTPLPHSSGLGS